MLQLTVPDRELFDDAKQEFLTLPGFVLRLEHSLLSVSKWEAEFQKPFFGTEEKTVQETQAYIRCMDLDENTDPRLYKFLGGAELDQIRAYITDKQSATWFSEKPRGGPSRETVTSELVYYWMIALGIPFEPCQNWHFNRLQTLIRICLLKQEKPKKMSRSELASRNAALNAARRAKLGSLG